MLNPVEETLRTLGVGSTYKGYRCAVLAIAIAVKDEDRLTAVTKEIYQTVAEECDCTWKAVERNLRTVVARVWRYNAQGLCALARRDLTEQPTVAEFLDIVSNYLRRRPDVLDQCGLSTQAAAPAAVQQV